MKFLVISDIHGDTAVLDRLDGEFKQADAVLFAGDFSKCFEPQTAKPVLEALLKKHETIFAVTGNCDEPAFIEELEKADICVQNSLVFRDSLVFAGSGGALHFTGDTPNERSDEELVSDLRVIEQQPDKIADEWGNLILIAHQPPFNTGCDTISSGSHVGSVLLRSFIEKYQPLAVVTGHIHESFAADTIGKSLIINPGSLAEGRYAVLEIERRNGIWSVVHSELKNCS
ncbi:MAG: metallophosphoesterase family protein [Bacteroides sp.]|nr:metallophosphoesterase family protein [Prevotella sp.]MCM1408686.1 metallophosphoesterase family protein [Treponema brennaborense]MCM1470547.1 metallophosphoesterase family protein [Bacteroides sp.]